MRSCSTRSVLPPPWARSLRAFTHGHVQQLNAVLRQTLIRLAQQVPLLPGADEVVFVDLDSTHRQVYGYQKHGAAVGRLPGKKILHPLIATASTPIARPVVLAVRLRKGKAADVRGAGRFLAEALTTVRAIAPTARIVVRAGRHLSPGGIAMFDAKPDGASADKQSNRPASPMVDDDLVDRAREEDARHWDAHRRPISADTLRRKLRIGAARSRLLVAMIRADSQGRSTRDEAMTRPRELNHGL